MILWRFVQFLTPSCSTVVGFPGLGLFWGVPRFPGELGILQLVWKILVSHAFSRLSVSCWCLEISSFQMGSRQFGVPRDLGGSGLPIVFDLLIYVGILGFRKYLVFSVICLFSHGIWRFLRFASALEMFAFPPCVF